MSENESPQAPRPLVAVETNEGQSAYARVGGVAFHTNEVGLAECARDGVAYCERSGEATSFGGGVAYVRNGGIATTGDGGVSVCKGEKPEASCEGWGVAFARSESYAERGKVKGGATSVLVISWKVTGSTQTEVRSVQVGGTDGHCTDILPGVWYTLDSNDSTKWVRA